MSVCKFPDLFISLHTVLYSDSMNGPRASRDAGFLSVLLLSLRFTRLRPSLCKYLSRVSSVLFCSPWSIALRYRAFHPVGEALLAVIYDSRCLRIHDRARRAYNLWTPCLRDRSEAGLPYFYRVTPPGRTEFLAWRIPTKCRRSIWSPPEPRSGVK